jgi:hypothetical protein
MCVESIYPFYYFRGEKSSELLDGFFLKENFGTRFGCSSSGWLGNMQCRSRKGCNKAREELRED